MPTSILIDPGTRFTCVPCGFCCSFWDIPIERHRKDALLQKDWVRRLSHDLEEHLRQPLFRILGQDDQSLILRRHGTCGFLDNRLLCSIHAAEGFDAKPAVCQQYPNIYYETPRGVEVVLDYSCPEVIRNTGELVRPEAVAKTLPREYVQKVGSTLPLNSRTRLDWEGYLPLEEALLQILEETVTYEEKILRLNHIIERLGQELKDQPSATRREVVEALLEIRAASNSQFSRQAQQPPNASKRDLYLAILVQWVESSFSAEVGETAMGAGKVLVNIFKQWKEVGEHTFETFKFHLKYGRMRDIAFNAESHAVRDPLDRYLKYQVRSLVATGRIPFAKRLGIIATNFALVKWFGRAHAASNERQQVDPEDIIFAIKVVEKFLSNRLFNKLAEQRTFLSNYINLLFDNPTLPGTMLCRP